MIKTWKIGIVTIVPYWPFLNPIESYIRIIKSKFRAKQRNYWSKTFKPISLKLLQNAFDDWAKINPSMFIKNSRNETASAIAALEAS